MKTHKNEHGSNAESSCKEKSLKIAKVFIWGRRSCPEDLKIWDPGTRFPCEICDFKEANISGSMWNLFA